MSSVTSETSTEPRPQALESAASIEERLQVLEAAIAEIRCQLPPQTSLGWLEQVIGSQKDEPAFDEVIALGRAFRMADRPKDDDPS